MRPARASMGSQELFGNAMASSGVLREEAAHTLLGRAAAALPASASAAAGTSASAVVAVGLLDDVGRWHPIARPLDLLQKPLGRVLECSWLGARLPSPVQGEAV